MAEFNPICESLTIKFICPECGKKVISESLFVPSPDFSAEKNSDSMNYDVYEVDCHNCGHTSRVTIYNAMYGGELEVDGTDDVEVEEFYDENDDINEFVYDLTPEGISDILNDIDTAPLSTKEFLYRQLFAGTISSMEAFLFSTLISEVLSSDDNKRNFIEKYLPYRDKKVAFSSLFQQMESLDSIIRETLCSLSYNNLAKIKPLYKDVLDIDLGDISCLMKAVQIRHDIVHRAGKNKDGIPCSITKEDVITLVEQVSSLMFNVNKSKKTMVSDNTDVEFNDTEELPF